MCSETVHGVSNKTVQSGHGGAGKERAVGSPSPEVLQNCGDAALRDVWMGWGWTWGIERVFFSPSVLMILCAKILKRGLLGSFR